MMIVIIIIGPVMMAKELTGIVLQMNVMMNVKMNVHLKTKISVLYTQLKDVQFHGKRKQR